MPASDGPPFAKLNQIDELTSSIFLDALRDNVRTPPSPPSKLLFSL
jgi:hypothetical protein